MQETLKKINYSLYRGGYWMVQHDGIELSGYLAFLLMLAFFPFLVILAAAIGQLGEAAGGIFYIQSLLSHLPPEAITALEPRINEILSGPPAGLLSLSILGALWTASSAVEGYRTVLNRAYRVHTPPSYAWRRMMSVLQLVFFTILMLSGMMSLIFLPVFWQEIGTMLGMEMTDSLSSLIGDYITTVILLILWLVVALMYYVLPNVRQQFLLVLPGAALTVILWKAAMALFSFYLANVDQVNIIYGSLGGIIAALIFFFLVNVVFILGAEFNYMILKQFGFTREEREHVDAPAKELDMKGDQENTNDDEA